MGGERCTQGVCGSTVFIHPGPDVKGTHVKSTIMSLDNIFDLHINITLKSTALLSSLSKKHLLYY